MDLKVYYNRKGVFGWVVILYLFGEFACILSHIDIIEIEIEIGFWIIIKCKPYILCSSSQVGLLVSAPMLQYLVFHK